MATLVASGAPAQSSLDFDVTGATKLLTHGRVTDSRFTLAPRGWLFLITQRWAFSAGASTISEPGGANSNAISLRGDDGRVANAANGWLEVGRASDFATGRLGFNRDAYLVSPRPAGLADLSEIYASIETPRERPIVSGLQLSARYWHGVGATKTRFGELGVRRQILLLPLNDAAGALELATGADLSSTNRTPPNQVMQYVRAGIRAGSTRRCDHDGLLARLIPEASLQAQWGLVPATQQVSMNRRRPMFLWADFNVWPRVCSKWK